MQSLGQSMRVLAATQAVLLLILGLSRVEAIDATSNEIAPKKVVYEVDIDHFIDEHMEIIKSIAADLDPLKLDDINFPVSPYVYMFMHTGWAQNLAQLQRTGKCKINYADKKLNIDLQLGWDDFVFDYRYLLRMLLVKREGDLHGQMTKLNVHIALSIDFRNFHITLEKLDLEEKGYINISLEGHLLDKIYNLVIKAVTRVFRSATLDTIKEKMRGMIVHRIDEINYRIGQIINRRLFTFVDLTKPSSNYDDYYYAQLAYYNSVDDNNNNDRD